MRKIALPLLLLCARTAAAAPLDDLRPMLAEIDADPAGVFTLRPRAVIAAIDWMRSFGGPLGKQIRDALDVFAGLGTSAEWRVTGLDPDAPVVAAVRVVGGAALAKVAVAPSAEAAVRAAEHLAVFVHTRFVTRPNDAKQLIGWMGLEPGKIAKRGGFGVLVRSMRGLVILDVITPLVAPDYDKEAARLKETILAPVRAPGAAKVLDSGAGTRIGTADISGWIDPTRAVEVVAAKQWGRTDAGAQKQLGSCLALRPKFDAGAFSDLAFTVRVEASAVDVGAAWGLRAADAAEVFATFDDHLIDVGLAGQSVMVGVLSLVHPMSLGNLPRVGPIDAALGCASGLAPLFDWPGLVAELLGAAAPADVTGSLRNIAVAGRSIGTSGPVAVQVASFDAAAGRQLDALLGGAPTARTFGARHVDVWPGKAFRTPAVGGVVTYGRYAGEDDTLRWFFGSPSPHGSAGPPPSIGLLRVDLPQLLGQIAAIYPNRRDLFDEAAKHLGQLRATIDLDRQTLGATIHLEIH